MGRRFTIDDRRRSGRTEDPRLVVLIDQDGNIVPAYWDSLTEQSLQALDELGIDVDVDELARTCRVCGCTELRACPGRCWWIPTARIGGRPTDKTPNQGSLADPLTTEGDEAPGALAGTSIKQRTHEGLDGRVGQDHAGASVERLPEPPGGEGRVPAPSPSPADATRRTVRCLAVVA